METIKYFIHATPGWVYAIMAYLLFIGIKSLTTNTTSLTKLCVIPVVFVWLSIHTLMTVMPVNTMTVGSWIVGLIIGSIFGWLLVHRLHPEIDKKKWLIRVPGSSATLIFIVIIFTFKYYLGYTVDVHPEYFKTAGYAESMSALSAATSGLFVGRVLYYARLFFTEPSVDLEED